MTTPENPNNDVDNGFGYGQLEHGELNMGSEKKDFGSGLKSRIDLCISYLSLGKREVWTKVKESNLPKYINEHRVGTLVIFILILFCFSILLHLSLQVRAGINTQNNNDIRSGNCTSDYPCDVGRGFCTSDKVCKNDLKCGGKKFCRMEENNELKGDSKCCYKSNSPRNLTSSSIFDNDQKRYGPQNLVTGSFYSFIGPYFKSKKEDFPWVQWKLPRQVNMAGITLVGRDCPSKSSDCPVLRDIEVRAGSSYVDDDYSGIIKTNEVCGSFKGPGHEGGIYTIKCKSSMMVDVITVQLKDDDSLLQISSMHIEKGQTGSECNGVSSCCIPGIPCDEGEGDCDSTLDCKEGLVCGHNNCPKKDGGYWDIADDCCYKPEKVKGSAIASSIYKDQRDRYSPRFAVDGDWSSRSYNVYTSKIEKMPWLQWNLPNKTRIKGISISNEYGISKFRNNTHKSDLVNFEVRAGLTSLPEAHKGKITINQVCGRIEIRGGEDRVYPVICDNSILADYVTIQVIDDNAMLQINELEIIIDNDDSKVDCSCHEYINANGYGQCKKGSSYEHVKGKKVCYVNQPSNCTDLTYSSTDPGKKFSAQACELEVKEEGPEPYDGEYDCKRQGCWLNPPYELDKDYGFYSESDSNCTMCKEKCNNDPECGAIECGGDKDHSTCAWWKFDKCTDKNSPDFFTYTKEQYHYGYTCYKVPNCPWLTPTDHINLLQCMDGTFCNAWTDSAGWKCCDKHKGRAKCPKNLPLMCADENGCAEGSDHCCERECSSFGGLRKCEIGNFESTTEAGSG